jgi:hypothetical protein
MITFRCTKQSFQSNTFIAIKTTPIVNTLNAFDYLKSIDKKGKCIVWWYSNFIKSELTFKLKDLVHNYKSIYPYYNTKFIRGNIWKYSYITLLNHIHKDKGFSCIKVDKITYKINPLKKSNVIINDARFALENKITILEGKIVNITNHNHLTIYTIKTKEDIYYMPRNYFSLLPQDYFDLLSIRCN